MAGWTAPAVNFSSLPQVGEGNTQPILGLTYT